MSVNYFIIPYAESLMDKSALDWLAANDVTVPPNLRIGKEPTVAELRNAILEIGYKNVQFQTVGNRLMVDILESQFSWVIIETYTTGNENDPHHLVFKGDEKLIISVVEKLAEKCGSFILHSEGENPIIIK